MTRLNIHDHAIFCQNWTYEISHFLDFYDCCHAQSWIFKLSNIWSHLQLGWLICIAETNFIKIGETVAEISILDFFKFDF